MDVCLKTNYSLFIARRVYINLNGLLGLLWFVYNNLSLFSFYIEYWLLLLYYIPDNCGLLENASGDGEWLYLGDDSTGDHLVARGDGGQRPSMVRDD
jgi:hypothetical protein